MTEEQRRDAAAFWYEQVDAAAVVEADAKNDGGGRARRFGRHEEEDDAKRHREEKWKGPPGPIYKGKGISDRRENQGAQNLDMRRSCCLDCRRLINKGGLCAVFNNR